MEKCTVAFSINCTYFVSTIMRSLRKFKCFAHHCSIYRPSDSKDAAGIEPRTAATFALIDKFRDALTTWLDFTLYVIVMYSLK